MVERAVVGELGDWGWSGGWNVVDWMYIVPNEIERDEEW